jgi:tetratricopeptide (TPR) repeat protein
MISTSIRLGLGLGLALASSALSSGCVSMTVGMTAPVVKIASADFNREADLELAREASPGQIKTAEGFLAADPENRILLEVVTRGYLEYTFGFLEDDIDAMPDDPKHAADRERLTRRATELYDRALAFALRLVALEDKNFKDAFMKDVAATEAEAKKLDKDAVPGLFYTGMALASGINLNRNDVARVVDLPKAVALIKRAYQLDPTFSNGQPALTMGVITGSQGKAMGGDPDASKKYFEEAIAASGGKYLMSKVMMARVYAVTAQDRPLFEKLLKEVIDAPANIYPEYRLANELAKKKAKRYLARIEDYF